MVALAMILVSSLSQTVTFDRRASRRFTEGIQAVYLLKSTTNFGRTLLELPKSKDSAGRTITEDWLGEPWALIAAAPSLPIGGLGEPKLMIVDEDGKLDLNSISSIQGSQTGAINPSNAQAPFSNTAANNSSPAVFWQNAVREIFYSEGFTQEQYDRREHRTLGDRGYRPSEQVAILHDWIDSDRTSFRSPVFDGEGIESSSNKEFFFNRPLRSLSEALLVPGFTLERMSRVAPYLRVSPSLPGTPQQINVNTAPYKVLLAIGFSEAEAVELIQERSNAPINRQILATLSEGRPQLRQYTNVMSDEFSIYVRIKMPSVTRWSKAIVAIRGQGNNRKTLLRSFEIL